MFGEKLKSLRKDKKLSQEDFAIIFGVGRSTVTKWERNEREPDFDTLIKIADYFNVTTDHLLDRYQDNAIEIISQIIILVYALNAELEKQQSLPEAITVYKEYRTQIDRLLLDLLSYRVSD